MATLHHHLPWLGSSGASVYPTQLPNLSPKHVQQLLPQPFASETPKSIGDVSLHPMLSSSTDSRFNTIQTTSVGLHEAFSPRILRHASK
eukprot:1518336-Amphidinium_carterae.1